MLDSLPQIAVAHENGSARFELTGAFDLGIAPELQRLIFERLETGVPVVVDLGSVTFADSTTLAVFVRSSNLAKLKQTEFLLVKVPPGVLRLLEVTGLEDLANGSHA